MKQDKLVSVFVPLYNCEAFIEETLESLRVQTYKNLEIVVVNDGSTDHSVELVENFPDKRIKLYHNPCNKGIPYTRNRGLEYATGEYFAFLDSDDIAVPDRIEKSVAFLEAHPDIHMVCGRYDKLVDGKLERSKKSFRKPYRFLDGDVLFNMPILTSTWMLRSSLYRNHHLQFDEEFFYMEDYQFLADAIRYSSAVQLNEVFAQYRIGHASITKVTQTDRQRERRSLFRKINERVLNSMGVQLTSEEKETHIDFIQNLGKKYTVEQLQNWKKILHQIAPVPVGGGYYSGAEIKRRYSYAVSTSAIGRMKKLLLILTWFKGENLLSFMRGVIKAVM